MRRKVQLSSLSVGRCFTLVVEPGASYEESSAGAKRSGSILSPDQAWRIADIQDDGVHAVNAIGQEETFPGDREVVEIAREGYDKLVPGQQSIGGKPSRES